MKTKSTSVSHTTLSQWEPRCSEKTMCRQWLCWRIKASMLQSLGGAGAKIKKNTSSFTTHTHMHIHTQHTTGSNRQRVSVNGVIGSSLQRSKNRAFSQHGIVSTVAVPHPAALELIRRESYAWNTIKKTNVQMQGMTRGRRGFHTQVASFQSHSS